MIRAGIVVFVGTLASILLVNVLLPDVADGWFSSASYALSVLVGLVAIRILGPGSPRASLSGLPSLRGVAEGLGVGLLTPVVAWGYVLLLTALLGPDPAVEESSSIAVALFATALLPALFEEWLDRGVLWLVCLEIGRARQAILITSLLFAVSHVFAASPMVFPLFFAMGCVLGWLRHRHDSLVPGIVAHFTHNAVVTLAA